MPVKVKDIIEGERTRETYKNVDNLAESISQKGLLQPIGITNDMRLVFGGRRLKAIEILGWEFIPDESIVYKGDLTDYELKELELLENLEREDLTWQEEIQGKAKLDKLKKELYGDAAKDRTRDAWSTRKSAELIGESATNFNEDISLAQAMEHIPELASCETKSDAKRKLNKMFDSYDRKQSIKNAPEDKKSSIEYAEHHFRIGDAREELKKLNPTMVYFIEVDPPYGIDLVEHVSRKPSRKKSETHERYEEVSRSDYITFCSDIAENLYRIAGDNCWMIWWFAWEHYEGLFQLFTEIGWKVDRVPSIWHKIQSACASQNPKYLPYRDYEQFLLCRKGQPIIEQSHGNVYAHRGVASSSRICSTEKPVELYEEIIGTLVPNGIKCIGCIPFLGSGSCLRALYRLGHTGFGWDLSEENKNYFLSKVLEGQK